MVYAWSVAASNYVATFTFPWPIRCCIISNSIALIKNLVPCFYGHSETYKFQQQYQKVDDDDNLWEQELSSKVYCLLTAEVQHATFNLDKALGSSSKLNAVIWSAMIYDTEKIIWYSSSVIVSMILIMHSNTILYYCLKYIMLVLILLFSGYLQNNNNKISKTKDAFTIKSVW